MASLKKKKVSKKLKISWRKHVNINDVEEYLEEKRSDERIGSLAEVKDSDLFQLDNEAPVILSAKEKRKLRASKPLKCFSALESHSAVPAKSSNRVRTKEERKSKLVKLKEQTDRRNGIVKAKQRQVLRDRKLHAAKSEEKPKRGEYNDDIWAEKTQHEIEKDEWAERNTQKHNLRSTGVAQKKTATSLTFKKTLLPTVEAPHPGMSYNPSYEDHQDLLRIVAEKEAEFIKREKYLLRNTRGMFKKVLPSVRDNNWVSEMSEGLAPKGDKVDEESDSEYKAVNPPVKNVKKTVKQRRKQKEQRELLLQRKAVKLEKSKVTGIHQIKVLHKEIDKAGKKQEVIREKRKKRAAHKSLEPKRLSSLKFEDPGLDFNMGGDIAGNLRNVKKEGSLLTDRFKSMQRRNILEPAARRHVKRSKVKKYTKPTHKEDWKKTVAK